MRAGTDRYGRLVTAGALGDGCRPSSAAAVCPTNGTSRIEIHLFGPLEIVGPTGRVTAFEFPSRKAEQVGALLALARGRPVSKDRLVDLLWGDKVPRDPSATVEHAVSLLRTTLATVIDVPTIRTEHGRYRFDTQQVSVDLTRFDELLEVASRLIGLDRLTVLRQAAALVTGDVLESEATAPWAEIERDQYRRRIERLALDIAELALAHDDAEVAHQTAERARLASGPVLEEAYALDISALVHLGRRHEARSLMRELERRLADEEGSAPSAQTAALWTLLRPTQNHGSRDHGARGSAEVITTVLEFSAADFPAAELPLIGREGAMATIEESIERAGRGDNGLVVVEGVAGVGKTRLLSEIALRHRDRVADQRTHLFACLPADRPHPLLAASRLLRVLARAAGMGSMRPIGDAAAPMFGHLADVLDGMGPVVLLIDDLHLADPVSLDLFRSLVAPGAVGSLCIVGAGRPPVPGAGAVSAGAASRTLHLCPLDETDVESLRVTGAWSETGGHPASLAACLRASRRGGALDAEAVRDVLALVDDADHLTRMVLELVAVHEQPAEITEVARRSRLAREMTAELLERAAQSGLLRVDSGRFAFASDLTRRVVLAFASPSLFK